MTKHKANLPATKAGGGPAPDDKAKRDKQLAAAMANPAATHGAIARSMLNRVAGGGLDQEHLTLTLNTRLKSVRHGVMGSASDMLAGQAFSLDAIYIEMVRRAGMNLGEYPEVADRYMRLAFKAQAQSRATLEALARLHQPREQTVKHVHVTEGGQAVVADQFHQHMGDLENEKSVKQSDATGAAGTIAALPGPDPFGIEVSVPGCERQAALQDARRNESGGTSGQPQRLEAWRAIR